MGQLDGSPRPQTLLDLEDNYFFIFWYQALEFDFPNLTLYFSFETSPKSILQILKIATVSLISLFVSSRSSLYHPSPSLFFLYLSSLYAICVGVSKGRAFVVCPMR